MPSLQPPSAPSRPRDDWTFELVLLLLSATVVLLAATMQVQQQTRVSLAGFVLPELCGWRVLFGWNCPGCGLTRSFITLAHGDLMGSLRYHPLGFVLFGLVAAQLPWRLWRIWRQLRQGAALPVPLPVEGSHGVELLPEE